MTKIFKNRGAKIFSAVCLLVCLTLSVSLADLFSSIITTNAFSASTSKIKSENFSLYAISLYSTTTQNQAQTLSQNAKQKNSAGYIYQTDTAFYVLASAYENISDAQKVETNLKNSNTSCEIIEIKFPKIEVSLSMTPEEKTALENAVCVYRNMYKKLYDLSVSVDTNLLNEIESKVELSSIISTFTKIKSEFEALFNLKINTSLLEIKLSLENVEQILDNLAKFSDSQTPYCSQIKHCYFEILAQQLLLYNTIN
ncbi:MAG: SPOR domain-containing protein [Clostridia bacterium]|nr:SPOR domain-containing protein [Clostridia bacterium]